MFNAIEEIYCFLPKSVVCSLKLLLSKLVVKNDFSVKAAIMMIVHFILNTNANIIKTLI